MVIYAQVVFSSEHEQYSHDTPAVRRVIEGAEHDAECPTQHGRQEPVHADGRDEAGGHSPQPDYTELHHCKRCRGSFIVFC